MSHELISPDQCLNVSPRGQHCRMLRADGQSFCAYHLQRAEAADPDPEVLAAELLDGTGNLNTADRVNALLANTVKQFARQRIDRTDALAVGYLAQMLLNTVPGVQKEHQAIRNAEARQALRKSIAESHSRRRPGQPDACSASALTSSTGLSEAAKGTPVYPEPRRACALVVTDQNLAAPPSHTFAHQPDDAELSDEALLAVVLEATSPQQRR